MSIGAWALARRIGGWLWLALIYLFLLSPLVVVVGASFAPGDRTYIEFPPSDITLKWYREIPPGLLRALGLSVGLALLTALAAVAVGVPAAIGMVRADMPGKRLLGALFRSPLQIPTVVIGVSFLQLYYVFADLTGIAVVDSLLGMVVAHFFMATPYVIGPVVAVLQRFNPRLEEAALSLGAGRWSTFRRVTFPVIMPGIYVGALYGFMISFSDLPVSLMLAGSGFRTFPVEMFLAMDYDFNPAMLAVSTLIIVFSLVALVMVQRLVGLNALVRTSGGS
jgi:putative spermidine/putrescine transport system permease protein